MALVGKTVAELTEMLLTDLDGTEDIGVIDGTVLKHVGTDTIVSYVKQETNAEDLADVPAYAGNGELFLRVNTAENAIEYAAAPGGDAVSETNLLQGTLTAHVVYTGTSVPTIASSASGVYTITIPADTKVQKVDIVGDNADVAGDGSLTVKIDNSANSQDKYWVCQIIKTDGNQLLNDLGSFGITITQVQTSNTNTITFPSMGSFGTDGFKVLIR